MTNRDLSEKIGLRPLLIYAQGQTGLNLCQTLLGLHLLYFYTDRKGLSPSLAGLAFFLALGIDALTDPWVGNISDRARFKSGRRRPFFLASIPMAVCYYLLLSPPPLGPGLFIWFLSFYFLMLTARKFYETAYGALMPELTLDYDERTKISTYRQLLGTIGDISGALLPFAASYLFARGTDFKITGAICAIVVAGGAMLGYVNLRERSEFSTRERSRLLASLKSVAGNRPFVILLIAYTLAVMAINIPTVLLRFLATLNIPVVTMLRDSANYLRAAEGGHGVHEMKSYLVRDDVESWGPVITWLENRRGGSAVNPPAGLEAVV